MIVVQWATEEEDHYTRCEYTDDQTQEAWDHYCRAMKEWHAARLFLEADDDRHDWIVVHRHERKS